MKITFSERDKDYIKRINDTLEEGETGMICPVQEKDKKYYLEFTCTDPGKASAFVMNFLLYNDNTKELEEELGIRVNAVNYNVLTKDSVNEILQDTIKKIEEL